MSRPPFIVRWFTFSIAAIFFCTQCAFAHKPHLPPRKCVVLHIQDVHGDLEAQSDIAALLRRLIRQNRVATVALEGAFGPIDLDAINEFPYRQGVRPVADYLLDQKKISGPIHTCLTANTGVRVIGIDDARRYRANLQAYLDSRTVKKSADEALRRLKDMLSQRKEAVYNPRLLTFDRTVSAYRQGKLSPVSYFEILNIGERYRRMARLEASINFKQAEEERQQFSRRGGDPSQFPELQKYIRYRQLAARMDSQRLFEEIHRAERNHYAALIKTPTEQELMKESEHAYLAEKLVDFSLTKDQWEIYQTLGSQPAFESFERFYREAVIRDGKMADRLLARIGDGREGLVVLVTGGFHSEGIDRRLKKAGHAIVVYTPKMSGTLSASAALSMFLAPSPGDAHQIAAGLGLWEEARDPFRQADQNAVRRLLRGFSTRDTGVVGKAAGDIDGLPVSIEINGGRVVSMAYNDYPRLNSLRTLLLVLDLKKKGLAGTVDDFSKAMLKGVFQESGGMAAAPIALLLGFFAMSRSGIVPSAAFYTIVAALSAAKLVSIFFEANAHAYARWLIEKQAARVRTVPPVAARRTFLSRAFAHHLFGYSGYFSFYTLLLSQAAWALASKQGIAAFSPTMVMTLGALAVLWHVTFDLKEMDAFIVRHMRTSLDDWIDRLADGVEVRVSTENTKEALKRLLELNNGIQTVDTHVNKLNETLAFLLDEITAKKNSFNIVGIPKGPVDHGWRLGGNGWGYGKGAAGASQDHVHFHLGRYGRLPIESSPRTLLAEIGDVKIFAIADGVRTGFVLENEHLTVFVAPRVYCAPEAFMRQSWNFFEWVGMPIVDHRQALTNSKDGPVTQVRAGLLNDGMQALKQMTVPQREMDILVGSFLRYAAGKASRAPPAYRATIRGLIFGGGASSRLWPRENKISSDPANTGKPLLKQTHDRLAPADDSYLRPDQVATVTTVDLEAGIREQLGAHANIFAQPTRLTAMEALLWSMAHLKRDNPNNSDLTLVTTTADHIIKDEPHFRDAIDRAVQMAQQHDAIVAIGLDPTTDPFDWTGFGAIKMGKPYEAFNDHLPVRHLDKFVEKPKELVAQQFIDEGGWCWNAGMIVARIKTIEDTLNACYHETFLVYRQLCAQLAQKNPNPHQIEQLFSQLKAVAPLPIGKDVDYGIMALVMHAPAYVVLPKVEVLDAGTHDILGKVRKRNADGNIIDGPPGQIKTMDSRNSIFSVEGDRRIEVRGVDGIIVVHTPNGAVIMHDDKQSVQKVGKLATRSNQEAGFLVGTIGVPDIDATLEGNTLIVAPKALVPSQRGRDLVQSDT